MQFRSKIYANLDDLDNTQKNNFGLIKNLRVDDFIEDSKEYLESSLTKDSYVIILSETNLRKNHIYGSEIFSKSYGPFRNSYRRTEKYSGLDLFLSPSFLSFREQ